MSGEAGKFKTPGAVDVAAGEILFNFSLGNRTMKSREEILFRYFGLASEPKMAVIDMVREKLESGRAFEEPVHETLSSIERLR